VLSPVGLLTVALVAGVAAWLRWSKSGQNAGGAVQGFLGKALNVFNDFKATFAATFGGVKDALMAGDRALAGEVALIGLRLVFLKGIDLLANSVGGALGDFLGAVGLQIASGDFAGAWESAVQGMAVVFDKFVDGIMSVFGDAINGIISGWTTATQT